MYVEDVMDKESDVSFLIFNIFNILFLLQTSILPTAIQKHAMANILHLLIHIFYVSVFYDILLCSCLTTLKLDYLLIRK